MNIEKSNLIQLLSGFNQYDWAGLKKYIESPFFNHREDVKKVFYFLKKTMFPKLALEQLTAPFLLRAMGEGEKIGEQSLRHTMSFLFQLTKGYLIACEREKASVAEQTLFISALRSRGKYDLLHKSLAKIDREQSKTEVFTSDRLQQSYRLNLERHAIRQQSNRNDTSYLMRASQDLDQFFTLEKLRLYANFLVHQSMTQVAYEDPFIHQILNDVAQNMDRHAILVQMYAQACQAFSNFETEQHYFDFKQRLLAHGENLTLSQNKECFTIAVNYCIRKLNNGIRSFVAEVFELYQAGLKRKAFEEHGFLSRFTYKNIATAAMGMGNLDWAEMFLQEYKESLDPRYKEDTYRYNLAILQYKKENYDGTLELLRDVEFEDLFFNLNARTMLLKIFFEKELWSALDAHLDSFKKFLYRHNELGYQKKHYLHLVKFTRRLLRSYKYSAQKKKDLIHLIQIEPELAEKSWLLEKLA